MEFIHTNFQKELVSIETSLRQFQSPLLYNPLSYRPTTLIPLITDAWSTISNRSKCRPPCLICLIKYPIHEPERIYFCTMKTTWHQVLHLGRKIQKPCSFFHCIERNIIVKIIHIWDAQVNIQGYVVSRSDRDKRRGEGALLYSHESIPVSDIFDDGIFQGLICRF